MGCTCCRPYGLTPREMDIITALAEGLSNKEIAQRLGVTTSTIKNHLTNVYSKLKVYDRTQAALFAVRNKLAE